MFFPGISTTPTIADLARRARQSTIANVTITVEVSGQAGVRRSVRLIPVGDVHALDADSIVGQLATAVAAYERLEASG
jgi:hypothetical protein